MDCGLTVDSGQTLKWSYTTVQQECIEVVYLFSLRVNEASPEELIEAGRPPCLLMHLAYEPKRPLRRRVGGGRFESGVELVSAASLELLVSLSLSSILR